MIVWGDPGGEYYFSLGQAGALSAGVWNEMPSASLVNSAPAGRQAATDGKVYALLLSGPFGPWYASKYFPSTYTNIIEGYAVYITSGAWTVGNIILASTFNSAFTAGINAQVVDGAGHVGLFAFGQQVGSASSQVLTVGWNYIEIEARSFNGSTPGVFNLWVNDTEWISNSWTQPSSYAITSVTGSGGGFTATYNGTFLGGSGNALAGTLVTITGFTNGVNNVSNVLCTASGSGSITVLNNAAVNETHAASMTIQSTQFNRSFYCLPNTAGNAYLKDMYYLDASTSPNNTRLGDSTVSCLYDTGPGVNAQWSLNPGTNGVFNLTAAANASGGNTVYTGSFGSIVANQLVGMNLPIAGFSTGANNGTFKCIANTTTTVTVNNPAGVAETHAATATVACPVQDGINHLGTWPDGDNTYIADATLNDISDFVHQPLSLTGTIYAVMHATYARKDDAGPRQFAQVCLSSSATEVSSTISATNSYLYYYDIVEKDPNTSAAWTLSGFNGATFGVKELT